MDFITQQGFARSSLAPPSGGQITITGGAIVEWVVPPDVYLISAVTVGAGGGSTANFGGGGGGLAWASDVAVTPGEVLEAIPRNGGSSTINSGVVTLRRQGGAVIVRATSGTNLGAPGTFSVGQGGGDGGRSLTPADPYNYTGGGGAAGFSGNGGDSGNRTEFYTYTPEHLLQQRGKHGTGGGGGGGCVYGSGGGVGLQGEGANGLGGSITLTVGYNFFNGSGGSGGQTGGGGVAYAGRPGFEDWAPRATGGLYGGGSYRADALGKGGAGAIRIIWGAGRAFPSTNTEDV